MNREQFTNKLVRILQTVQAGGLPAPVREVYVFGSYARGALEPGDLDLLVVHGRARPDYEEQLRQHFERKGHSITEQIFKTAARFEADMRRALRKPGERVEILLTPELNHVVHERSKIRRDDLVFLWSDAEPDYRPRLEALRPDPAAGRAPRDHIISLKRLHDDLTTMERTVALLHGGALVLTRLPVAKIECRLNQYHAGWLAWWTECKIMGRDSLLLLPYAMWWLEQHRQTCDVPDQLEVWSKSRTHRLHLGRPSLAWMLGAFRRFPRLRRQCLIPHIKVGQPNELLVFERGRNWSKTDARDDFGLV